MSRRVVAAASGIAFLAACARIAGLASSDELGNAPTKGGSFPENEAGAVVSPQQLVVEAGCGVANDSDYVAIQNKGDHALSYEVTSPSPELVGLEGDPDGGGVVQGTVAASSVKLVHVHVAGNTPGAKDSTLYVKTTADTKSDVQTIPVTVSVDGAELVFTKPVVNFGQVRQNVDAPPQTVEIQNTGNMPVTITGWTPVTTATDFNVTDMPTIAAGDKATATAHFVAGPAGDPLSASFGPTTSSSTCTMPSITLQGQRVSQDVTVNPTELTFTQFQSGATQCVACGASVATGLEVTLSNFSPTSQATVTVSPTTSFNVVPTTQTVPVASGATPGTSKLLVTPKAIGNVPGPVAENITLTITASGADPKQATVKAQYTVCGAILAFSAPSLSFNQQGECRQLTISNGGNIPVSFGIQMTGAFDRIGYPSSLNPGDTSDSVPFFCVASDVIFNGATAGVTYNGSIAAVPQNGSVLCGPPPTTILQGKF